jgi:hypothetical protein
MLPAPTTQIFCGPAIFFHPYSQNFLPHFYSRPQHLHLGGKALVGGAPPALLQEPENLFIPRRQLYRSVFKLYTGFICLSDLFTGQITSLAIL